MRTASHSIDEYSPDLERLYRQFEQAWFQAPPQPDIANFLPSSDCDRSTAIRELVHLDLEFRLKSHEPVRVEKYVERFPDIANDETLAAWISTEYCVRSATDRSVSTVEYLTRFPHLHKTLTDCLAKAQHDRATDDGFPRDSTPTELLPFTQVPKQLGRFEILEKLGSGGFGTVYRALDATLGRHVAIKVLRAAVTDDASSQRFLREARNVAHLSHPGIVPLYDAGEQDGLRYLVNELVEGVTLAEAKNQKGLSTRTMVEWMATICSAIHYAHQRGVIHRDLKPANVILEAGCRPRVTDFGLALRHDEHDSADQQILAGTPPYMSPEHAAASSRAIDSRSDIYSLGVMLFELLTGRTPFQGTPRQVLALSKSQDSPSPRDFVPDVPRDLEAITLKCLQRDPIRRYASAGELADDLGRWLNCVPVSARPVSWLARLRMWCKRNPRVALLSCCIAGLLATVTIGSSTAALVVYNQRRTAEALAERNRQLADSEHAARLNAQDRQQEAESARQNEAEERKSADAVAQMMIKFLRRADPEVDGSQLTIAAALDRAFAELTADKQVKPRVRGGVLLNIGQTWAGLGRYLDALKAYQEATRLFEMEYGADDRDALLSQTKVAEAYYLLGDSHRAIDMYRRLLPRLNAVMGERHEVTLSAVDGLGSALTSVGRVAESVVLLEENLKSAQATLGTQDANSWMAMHSLGQAKVAAGQFDDAIYLLRSALSYRQASLPATHPSVLTTTRNLAMALQWSGQYEDGLQVLRGCLTDCISRLGQNHPETLLTQEYLAESLADCGQFQEATQLAQEAWRLATNEYGETQSTSLRATRTLASVLRAAGRPLEAQPLLDELLSNLAGTGKGDSVSVFEALNESALAASAAGELSRATELLEMAYQLGVDTLGAEHFSVLTLGGNLAQAYNRIGDNQRAMALFEALVPELETSLNPEHPTRLAHLSNYACALRDLNRFDEAQEIFENVLIAAEQAGDFQIRTAITTRHDLAILYNAVGRHRDAIELGQIALQQSQEIFGDLHPQSLALLTALGEYQLRAGDINQAIESLEESQQLQASIFSEDHPSLMQTRIRLAECYGQVGRGNESVPIYLHIIRVREETLEEDHAATLQAMTQLARVHETLSQFPEALALHLEVLQRRILNMGENNVATNAARNNLSRCFLAAGDQQQAESICRQALESGVASHPNSWVTFDSRAVLGDILFHQGNLLEAEALLSEGYAGLVQRQERILPQMKYRIAEVKSRLDALQQANLP